MFLVRKLFFGPLDTLAENADVLDLRYKNPPRFVWVFQQCVEEKESRMLAHEHD